MKIVVTGGAGFIASQIVDAYIERGHEVHIFDDFSTGQRSQCQRSRRRCIRSISPIVKAVKLIEQIKPDVLSHHAAQMDVRHSVADPTFDARVNIIGFINLLEGCKNAGVKKVIFASSGGAVYGEQESFPAPESHATQPASPYGVSKRTGELYLSVLSSSVRAYRTSLCVMPMFTARASRPKARPAWWRFLVLAITGKTPVINGDGKQSSRLRLRRRCGRGQCRGPRVAFVGPDQHRYRRRNRRGDDLQSSARGLGSGSKRNMARQNRREQRRSCIDNRGAPAKFSAGGRKWHWPMDCKRTADYYREHLSR